MEDDRLRSYMAGVSQMDRFLTVDELYCGLCALAEAYPQIARLRRVGTSSLGDPIHMLSIGDGSRDALIFGCPHPNEPFGAMMVNHLTRLLCTDDDLRAQLNYTWHFIPCIDPDGTRLNEPWFAGPFTVTNYARSFYRPAHDEQVEWTFPISYKKLFFDRVRPETLALMRVIDEVQPRLMAPLHNSGFGGVYYYLSQRLESLYDTFALLPIWEGLPLHLGEPEDPGSEQFAPGLFRMLDTRRRYDFLEAAGADPAISLAGASSHDYASKYGTVSLMVEAPYFENDRVNDVTPTGTVRRDALLAGIVLEKEIVGALKSLLDGVKSELRGRSPFQRALTSTLLNAERTLEAQRTWVERSSAKLARPATVAELFSTNELSRFYRLLYAGQMVRMLEGEVAIGNHTPKVRSYLAAAHNFFDHRMAELEHDLDYRALPIRNVVAVQLAAVLLTASIIP